MSVESPLLARAFDLALAIRRLVEGFLRLRRKVLNGHLEKSAAGFLDRVADSTD
jgi:uncharacterized membrane protein YciS (DUF1049 family)